jgi:hypothetical protein
MQAPQNITLTLTPDEARWLVHALSIAASACAEPAPTMGRWAAAFARGLEAKLQKGGK